MGELDIEIQETGEAVPSPLKPITERQLKKAKRTRNALVTMIVIGIVALAAIILLGYMVFSPSIKPDEASNQTSTIVPPNKVDTTTVVDASAPAQVEYEKTKIPEMSGLYGLTLEEVKTKLGSTYTLDPLSGEGGSAYTFKYEPKIISGATSGGSSKTPTLVSCSINLDFDEEGKVIDVVFLSDLRLLDYPEKSFAEFVSSDDVVISALQAAGVTPSDTSALNPADTTEYDNELSENRKLMNQTRTYHGSSTATDGMNKWDVVIKYDYGTGVASADEYSSATRTIRIKLYK